MRLQIISDIHLEFRDNRYPYIPQLASNITLLGDIGRPFSAVYARFIRDCSKRFRNVIVLAGNHEYYSTTRRKMTVGEIREKIREVCSQYNNVHFLDDSVVFIDGVRILGSTLWTFIPAEMWTYGMKTQNDYHMSYIGKYGDINVGVPLAPGHTTHWHENTVKWLKEELAAPGYANTPTVILTHHAPYHLGTSDPKYEKHFDQCFYSTDISVLFKSPVLAWAYGHTHYPADITVKGVRLVSNPLGYPGELGADYEKNAIDHPPIISMVPRKPPGL